MTISCSLSHALQLDSALIDQPWIYIILLAMGGILFLIQFKYMFFPTWKGKIIEFQELNKENCTSCKSNDKGKSSLDIKVKTDDGEIIDAEISTCTICLNKLRVGSRIGVSKVGSRHIAQPVIRLFRSRSSTW
jgi:hypothetical protein